MDSQSRSEANLTYAGGQTGNTANPRMKEPQRKHNYIYISGPEVNAVQPDLEIRLDYFKRQATLDYSA